MTITGERIVATYLVETSQSLERIAETIAGEQSSGTFVALPGESADLVARFGATVDSLEDLGEVAGPSLVGRYPDTARFRAGRLTISWPYDNVGPSLVNVLPAVLGNLTELIGVSGLRLLDLELPDTLIASCPGPRFSVVGTRRLTGVGDGPIVGTIVKPSVGLRPEETANLVYDLACAGVDFVKDDELIADPPYSPLEMRMTHVLAAIERAADVTGRRIAYAFNITGEVDEMRRRHDAVADAGGSCVMVCLNAVGLAGVLALVRDAELALHGHRAGWGLLTRHASLGIEFEAYQKLWRLAGVDQLHVNGLDSKFWEPDESVARSARACLEPLRDEADRAMPVFSSGQWGGQAPDTLRLVGSDDLIYLAGGGIIAHPGGPAAGVTAIREAWAAAAAGVPLSEYARERPALADAIAAFGGPA